MSPKGRILTRDNLIDIACMVNEEMDSATQSYQNELVLLSSAIEDINHRLERLYDAIETGKLNLDDVVVRIRDLQQRQQGLQAKRIEIESQMSERQVELIDLNTMTGYINEMQDVLGESTLTERRAFIRSFVQEIKVRENEAVLTYSPPIPQEMIALSGNTVPRIVHHGGAQWTERRTFNLAFSIVR